MQSRWSLSRIVLLYDHIHKRIDIVAAFPVRQIFCSPHRDPAGIRLILTVREAYPKSGRGTKLPILGMACAPAAPQTSCIKSLSE